MQKLLQPINDMFITAGYKTEGYRKQFKFSHYGVDLISQTTDRAIYALGDGEVIACGMDGNTTKDRMGNAVVIIYPQAQLTDGRVVDLTCRMYHFEYVNVKPGQKIKQGEVIGIYGNTGEHTTGPHLHIEFDLDTKFPQYAYGIARSGKIIKQGNIDSTIEPGLVFWQGGQQKYTYNKSDLKFNWINKSETTIPRIADCDYKEMYEKAQKEIEQYRYKIDFLKREILDLFSEVGVIK